MTKVFDCMSEGVRTAFDAGRRTQEAWFKAVGEMWKRPGDADGFSARGERIFREFAPFIGKNMEMAAQCCDAGIRTGVGVFNAACDAASKPGDTDAYDSTRQVWDATFQAVRTNFDTFGKAGARTMENCSAFCDAILRDDTAVKTPAGVKSGK
jgi:hypothetical protein